MSLFPFLIISTFYKNHAKSQFCWIILHFFVSNYENHTIETFDSYGYMKCMIVSMYIDIFIYNLGHVLLPKNDGLNTQL